MIETIKKNWILISIIGFSIVFSSRLYTLWGMPQQVEKTQEQVEELSSNLNAYTQGQEKANEQRDKLIGLLAQNLMKNDSQ